jgi:hypothetical protein
MEKVKHVGRRKKERKKEEREQKLDLSLDLLYLRR